MDDSVSGRRDPLQPARYSELRHGYTLASLEGLTRRAAFDSKWRFIAFDEKYETAWSAIAEELYSSEEPPPVHDLIQVGVRAITRHVEDLGHTKGVYYYRADKPSMPRFEIYWWWHAFPTPSPESRIVDVLALRQIWPRLTRTNQKVLLALAVHGDYQAAAAALNKPYSTFVTQIYEARRQFLRLWHDGEQPSRVWGRDRRKRNGPPQRSVTATTIRKRQQRARTVALARPSVGKPGIGKGKDERLKG